MQYFRVPSFEKNTDDDSFTRVGEELSSQDASTESHGVELVDKVETSVVSQDSSIFTSKDRVAEDSRGLMHEGGAGMNESLLLAREQSNDRVATDSNVYLDSDEYFKHALKNEHELINQVFKKKHFLHEQVIEFDKPILDFDVSFVNEEKQLLIVKDYDHTDKTTKLNILQIDEQKDQKLVEFLPKLQECIGSQNYILQEESIYYFAVKNEAAEKTFQLMKYNILSQEKQVLESKEIAANDIYFVEHKTQATDDITETFVALLDEQGVYSVRKISDLNEQLFAIECTEEENAHIKKSNISFSQYVNAAGQNVIIFKSRHYDEDKDLIKGFIYQNESWSQIEVDLSCNLKKQAEQMEQLSQTNMKNEISNARIADNNQHQDIEMDLVTALGNSFLKVSTNINEGGDSANGTIAENLIKKDKTKFCVDLEPDQSYDIIYDFALPVFVRGYLIETANDHDHRDPKDWEILDENGNILHEVKSEPTRGRFVAKRYNLFEGGAWCKQLKLKVNHVYGPRLNQCQISRFQVITQGNTSRKLITMDLKCNNLNVCDDKEQCSTKNLSETLSSSQLEDINMLEPNEQKLKALNSFFDLDEVERWTMMEDQMNKKIKIIQKEGRKKLRIKTYKTNHQFETLSKTHEEATDFVPNHNYSKELIIRKFKKDEFYPFKQTDKIQTITTMNQDDNHVEFKSSLNNKSVKLQSGIDKKQLYHHFSSELEEQNNKRSINVTLVSWVTHYFQTNEYKLRWEVDSQGNFLQWKNTSFLGDSKTVGELYYCCENISQGKIDGLLVYSDSFYKLPKYENLDYEFKDKTFKSTIKMFKNPKNEKYGFMSINRFTDEAIKKFEQCNLRVGDQYLLSQARHEQMMNVLPQLTFRDWLFKAEPSILRPMQCLDYQSLAFYKLGKSKDLQHLLYNKEPENQQLSIIQQLINDKQIGYNDESGEAKKFDGKEFDENLGDKKLSVSNQYDLFFHQNFSTLLSICFKGTIGDKESFLVSLQILLKYIVQFPSKLNKKIIQTDFVMLAQLDPSSHIQNLFEMKREEESEPVLIFFDSSFEFIEHFDRNKNYLKSILRVDDYDSIDKQFGDQLEILDNKGKHENIPKQANKAKVFIQEYTLHNARMTVEEDVGYEQINQYNFGKLMDSYTECVPENLESCDKIRSIIDFRFENSTKKYLCCQLAWFLFMFTIPFFILAKGHLRGAQMYIVMVWSLIGALGMYFIEIMSMKVEGIKIYFSQGWNYIDQFTPVFYVAFCSVLNQVDNCEEHEELDCKDSNDLMNYLKLLKIIIVISIWIKFTWFQKIFKSLGLLQQLLMGVFGAVVPFLAVYLFWIAFFAVVATMLGANDQLAEGYPGLEKTLFIGYFLNAFENSIGNINAPTISFLKKGYKPTFLDELIIYLIYLFWWGAQLVLLVVLLNFVIALISQYYEDVMNGAVMHTYVMRQELNHEWYVAHEFFVQIGFSSSTHIDALFLINGEEVESETEWKGLTQTMKKVFVQENDKTQQNMRREISLIREDMNAQFAEIKSLVSGLSKSE